MATPASRALRIGSRAGSCPLPIALLAVVSLAALLLVLPLPVVRADDACPTCHQPVEPGWRYCPVDGTLLQRNCPTCGREVQAGWHFCPDDGTALDHPPEGHPFFRPGEGTPPGVPPAAPGGGEVRIPAAPERSRNSPLTVIDDFLVALFSEDAAVAAGVVDWDRLLDAELSGLAGEERTVRRAQLVTRCIDVMRRDLDGCAIAQYRVDHVSIGHDDAAITIFIPRERAADGVTKTFHLAVDPDGWWWIVNFS